MAVNKTKLIEVATVDATRALRRIHAQGKEVALASAAQERAAARLVKAQEKVDSYKSDLAEAVEVLDLFGAEVPAVEVLDLFGAEVPVFEAEDGDDAETEEVDEVDSDEGDGTEPETIHAEDDSETDTDSQVYESEYSDTRV